MHFNDLQSNLMEIYASLSAKTQDHTLPLSVASSSSVYYTGSWLGQVRQEWDCTGRLIKTINLHPYFQDIVKPIFKYILQPSFVYKKENRKYQSTQLTDPKFSLDNVLKIILKKSFNQAVHQAYYARQRRIQNQINQLNEIWKNHLQSQDRLEQRNHYARYLSEELKGSIQTNESIYLTCFDQKIDSLMTESEERNRRHLIVNFHQATHFFWSIFIKKEKEWQQLRQPLIHLIDSSALTDCILFKVLKKEARWVQMEGIMQQSIPIDLLSKLKDPKSLTVEENRRLKSWVEALNRYEQDLSPKLLSIVLAEVMTVIELQGSSQLTLSDLLFWLNQQGCRIIHQEDPAHMDWREKLRFGDDIECNGIKLILGQQLSPHKEINDIYKIFELKDDPHQVVKIADNCFRLLIEDQQAQHEQEHWGVRLVDKIANLEKDPQKPLIKGLDQQGRCVVLEKLNSPFNQHVWSSKSVKLTDQDERMALVFANHLFCMFQWKASAQNLSLAHLMWSKDGVLKSTRLLKKGVANYNEWETYCENAANGNLYILKFLMNVSKLNEHPIALYYREAVEYTLKTGKTDLIGRPLPLGHRQDFYDRHVKKLCKETQELKENCCKQVIAFLRKKNDYSYKLDGKIKQQITDKLIDRYRASPTPGRLSPHLISEVMIAFTSSPSHLALSQPISYSDSIYYQEKHDLMFKYNQALLKVN